MRRLVLLAALASCDRGVLEDERLAHEGTAHAATVSFSTPPALPPAPPPPPPPPPPVPMAPPVEILDFLRSHASDTAPWQVTLYELDDQQRTPRFMGAHVRSQRALGRGASVRVVAKLAQSIYWDGDSGGWTTTSLGIRIARGPATLDLVYNAGHLFLTPEWHEGRFVVLNDTLWLDEL